MINEIEKINNISERKKISFFIKFKYFLLFSFIILFIDLNNENNNIKINTKFLSILPHTNSIDHKPKSLNEVFKSRQLFISDKNITNDYILYIRPIKKINKNNLNNSLNYDINFDENYFIKRKDQLDFKEFGKLCVKEELLYKKETIEYNEPYISIIIPTFNKEDVLMKSLRSIQNQSLKNIEIIIIDDCSKDNTSKYYNELLETDSRIRIFRHLKNMGVWRSRIDGLLYSRGKYVIHFDPGDLYEDNYVLEDIYNVIEKYNLDSIKMLFRNLYDYNNMSSYQIPFNVSFKEARIHNKTDMLPYNFRTMSWSWGVVWNRLTRNDIYIRGLYLLSENVLNIYKNLWEDRWWTRLADEMSDNLLIIKRFGYLYYQGTKGEGYVSIKTEAQKDKMIQEFIKFLYFDLELTPKENNKKVIINRLFKYAKIDKEMNLENFKSKFYLLDNLINTLIKDPYVDKEDKIFLYETLINSIRRQIKIKNKN